MSPWDDTKQTNVTLSDTPDDEKLTSSEWNSHVTDQKNHKSRHEKGGSDEITTLGSLTVDTLNLVSDSILEDGNSLISLDGDQSLTFHGDLDDDQGNTIWDYSNQSLGTDVVDETSIDLSISPTWTSSHTFDGGLALGGDIDLDVNAITEGNTSSETITESSSPTGFTFSGNPDRDVLTSIDVTVTNNTGGDVNDINLSLSLFDGTDNTGVLFAIGSDSSSLTDTSTTTVTLLADTDMALDDGSYFVELSSDVTIDSVDVNVEGATWTVEQNTSGGFEFSNQETGSTLETRADGRTYLGSPEALSTAVDKLGDEGITVTDTGSASARPLVSNTYDTRAQLFFLRANGSPGSESSPSVDDTIFGFHAGVWDDQDDARLQTDRIFTADVHEFTAGSSFTTGLKIDAPITQAIDIELGDGTQIDVNQETFDFEHADGDDFPYDLKFRKARGNLDSPSAVQSSDRLMAWRAYGYDGSSYVEAANLRVRADANATTDTVPTTLQWYTMDASGNIGTGTGDPRIEVGPGDEFTVPKTDTDPSKPRDGSIWYRTDNNEFRGVENGSVVVFSTSAPA